VELDAADVRQSLASLMDRAAGVFRERAELEPAMNALRHWGEYVYPVRFREPSGLELQNMLAVAALVVTGALERTESRGAHRRLDFPSRDDAKWLRRITRSVASE
jgi:fumarate reductase flavoprotein subunit